MAEVVPGTYGDRMPEPVALVVGLACAVVALVHLSRLAVPARGRDAVSDGAHAAMALGMVAMAFPGVDILPSAAWTAVFVLVGAWFAAVALRTATFGGAAGQHVVGAVAMLFMLQAGHAPDAAGSAGHAAHGGGSAGSMGLTAIAALLLAAYFAWHALRCSEPLRPAAALPLGSAVTLARGTAVLHSARTAAAAGLVMAVAMSTMLLAMV
jgi:hypothetical protein